MLNYVMSIYKCRRKIIFIVTLLRSIQETDRYNGFLVIIPKCELTFYHDQLLDVKSNGADMVYYYRKHRSNTFITAF